MTPDEARNIVDRIGYQDWDCLIEQDPRWGPPEERKTYLVWEWEGHCAITGDVEIFRSRKWRLSQHMTESEVVQTAFAALLLAVEHEVREKFRYDRARPFHPHIDIRALMEASRYVSTREEQTL